MLRAEGFSTSLDRIHSIARNIDSQTLSLQYFETLQKLGEGSSTEIVLPMEFTQLLSPFIEAIERGNGGFATRAKPRRKRIAIDEKGDNAPI